MKRRRGSILTAMVILGLIAYACIALMNMRSKVAAANETEAELRDRITEIQEKNAALQYAIDHQDDEKTIEDIARDKFGYVRDDEIIFYDAGEWPGPIK